MNELNNGSQIDKSCNKENENAQKTVKDLKSLKITDDDKNWTVEINDEDDELRKQDTVVTDDADETIALNLDFDSMSIGDEKTKPEDHPGEEANKCTKRSRRKRKRTPIKNAKRSKKVTIKGFDDPSTTFAIRENPNQSDNNEQAGPSHSIYNRGNPQKYNNRKRSPPTKEDFIQFGINDIRSVIMFEVLRDFFNSQRFTRENCTGNFDSDSDSLDE